MGSPAASDSSAVLGERVGKADLDERLAGDTKSAGLLVDLPKEVHRKVHVDTLNDSARADRFPKVHVGRQVDAGVVHRVEFGGGERSSLGGTLLFLHRVLA